MYQRKFSSGRSRFSSGSGPRSGGRPIHRSSGGRPSPRQFGGGRPAPRRFGKYIDPALFVNKAVVTETVTAFVPEHQFVDFEVDAALKANIVKKGYVTPTPIQDKAIPHVLKGQDVVGIANTGTGKTAAFLIPIINKILMNRDEQALIMVPTRELAIQINDEFRGFTPGLRLFSSCFVGGTSVYKDVQKLRQHQHVIIGTPGRLKDMLERKALNITNIRTVVLDEADRMLDMGFVHDMRTMLGSMPKDKQGLFFSATLTSDIRALISDFLKSPVTISVKTAETASSIDQDVVVIDPSHVKIDVLHTMLKSPEFDKVLIFGQTKHGVEKLAKSLAQKGIRAESIHGNKTHNHRQKALGAFKDNRAQVLVATDVAARGLDIPDVSHVINYDIPATYEDYVHRIGRTGRAGKRGKALTFVERRSGHR